MTFNPRTWVDDELVTADIMNEAVRDHLNLLPRGQLAYAILGSDTDVSAGVQVLTVTPTLPASRLIKVTALCIMATSAAGDAFNAKIRTGTTDLLSSGAAIVPFGAGTAAFLQAISYIEAPAGGSRNYNLWLTRIVGAGTMTAKGAGTQKCALIVEDAGPA